MTCCRAVSFKSFPVALKFADFSILCQQTGHPCPRQKAACTLTRGFRLSYRLVLTRYGHYNDGRRDILIPRESSGGPLLSRLVRYSGHGFLIRAFCLVVYFL